MLMSACAALLTAHKMWIAAQTELNPSVYSEPPPGTALPLDKQTLAFCSSLATATQ